MMSGWLHRVFFVLTLLGFTACSAVPVATMLRMSSFDERDFVALDADVLRVRVSLPLGIQLNAAKSVLVVEAVSGDRNARHTFVLEEEERFARSVSTGIWRRQAAVTTYVCRLTPVSKEHFRKLQVFAKSGRTDQIDINVHVTVASVPRNVHSIPVWVDLLADEKQGFFPLVEAGDLPIVHRPD
jgi:hypothetical protein